MMMTMVVAMVMTMTGYADDVADEEDEKKEDLVKASGLPSENWWSSTKEGGETVVNLLRILICLIKYFLN